MVQDDNFSMCTYKSPNRGQHPVIGQALFRDRVEGIHMIGNNDGWRIHYGFRGGGDKFLVHVEDVRLAGHLFDPVPENLPVAAPQAPAAPIPIVGSEVDLSEDGPPAPKRIDMTGIIETKDFDLQKLAGVTDKIAEQMKGRGVRSAQDVVDKGMDWLITLKGVGDARAGSIMASAKRVMEGA
jgi:hypothetical protein